MSIDEGLEQALGEIIADMEDCLVAAKAALRRVRRGGGGNRVRLSGGADNRAAGGDFHEHQGVHLHLGGACPSCGQDVKK